MKRYSILLRTLCGAFALTLLALSTVVCGGGPGEESSNSEPADAAETASEVEYEPAYPEEVSDEELSEDDTGQQESHSHGEGEEHAHGDDSHMNGDDDHMHDEHGDDGHQN